MTLEHANNPEQQNEAQKAPEWARERITKLQEKGQPSYEALRQQLGDTIPAMPERRGKVNEAQRALAKDLGVLEAVEADENPETRMRGALAWITSLKDQPLRSVDPSTLHASAQDLADQKSSPTQLL